MVIHTLPCSNQCEDWFPPFGGLFHIHFWTRSTVAGQVYGGVHLSPARPTPVLHTHLFYTLTSINTFFVCCLVFLVLPRLYTSASACAYGGRIGSLGGALYRTIASAPRPVILVSPATRPFMTRRLTLRRGWRATRKQQFPQGWAPKRLSTTPRLSNPGLA